MSDGLRNILQTNVRLLRLKASRTAMYGIGIGLAAIVCATLMTCFVKFGHISLDGIADVQKTNFALWVLNIMPFGFAVWGQYMSSMLAHEAGAMVLDQTEELRTEAAALKWQMRRKSIHDEVTGLANRAVFTDRLEQAVANATASGGRTALFALDMRRFGDINETLGHHHGDRLLKRIATRLENAIEAPATLARIRGNEFGIILPDLGDLEEIERLNKTVHTALEMPFSVEGLSIEMQAVTSAVVFPIHADNADVMLQKIDIALHEAKRQGREFLLYDPRFDTRSPQRLTLMGELRRAIRENELRLYLQPIVAADGKSLVGMESLVRWQHDTMGLIPPNEFIPLAEQSGAIVELSAWVLEKAMAYGVELRSAGLDIWVSANVSARVMLDPDFVDQLSGLLAGNGLPAESLVLEITEDTLMGEQQRVLSICEEIEKLGVHLAIDDFGTGYSQLSYLKRLPVSEIKIDRSFIADMMNSENDEVIVKATIDLGHTLGLKVIAEGIETEEQQQRLNELNCDMLQGYWIGRPMPFEALSDWLKDKNLLTAVSTD